MAFDELQRLADAVDDNWAAAWASLGRVHAHPPTVVDDGPDCLRVYTPGVGETLLNMVIRYVGRRRVISEDIERAIAPYRQHHLPFQWWLMRGREPDGLRDQLASLGMQSWGGAPAMALALDRWSPHGPAPHPALHVRRASSHADGEAAVRIICDVFYVPEAPMARWTILNPAFEVYVAHWETTPVAALATLRQGDVVGVYHVATARGMRRRGIAASLLVRALQDARAVGCTLATLTATPDARHLYERLGFRTCGLMEQWMPGPRLTHALTGDDYSSLAYYNGPWGE